MHGLRLVDAVPLLVLVAVFLLWLYDRHRFNKD